MRIIGGTHGGRQLRAPRGQATRPTGDRVREAIFSILGPLEGAEVLDLFAGSGALGLEALSRGAESAVLVDRAPDAARAIRSNLETLGLAASVRRQDARAFLRDAREQGRLYDLVFLDPPYRQAAALAPLLNEALGPVLAPGARVVAESDRRAVLELDLPLDTERRYGDTLIRIHSRP
ncbi:MAG: 16S rRNA (guanine(966)-N(2))-methyltransferase RsmD [Solirubrobacteraceae bacterium]